MKLLIFVLNLISISLVISNEEWVVYPYPNCVPDCLTNYGKNRCPGNANCHQVVGRTYQTSNNLCYKAITGCYDCLKNPSKYGNHLRLTHCAGIYNYPECKPECLTNYGGCPGHIACHQKIGRIYKVNNKCYEAISGCNGCLGAPEKYKTHLSEVSCEIMNYWTPESVFNYYYFRDLFKINEERRKKRGLNDISQIRMAAMKTYYENNPKKCKVPNIDYNKAFNKVKNILTSFQPRVRKCYQLFRSYSRKCSYYVSKASFTKGAVLTPNNKDCNSELQKIEAKLQKQMSILKMSECLAQELDGDNDIGAMHIETYFDIAVGLSWSWATGMAVGLDRSRFTLTKTSCNGIKLDISAGFGVSLSYMFDWDNIFGESCVIEVGADIPGTESGFDFGLFFEQPNSNNGNKWVFAGYGLSFGLLGAGIVPFDLAKGECNTEEIASHDSSALNFMINSKSNVKCSSYTTGVIAEKKWICCPENNPNTNCNSGFCWFRALKCPHIPQCINNGVKYTFCPGMKVMDAGKNSYQNCKNIFDNNHAAFFMKYESDSGICWHGNSISFCNCKYGPEIVQPSKIKFHRKYYDSNDLCNLCKSIQE